MTWYHVGSRFLNEPYAVTLQPNVTRLPPGLDLLAALRGSRPPPFRFVLPERGNYRDPGMLYLLV